VLFRLLALSARTLEALVAAGLAAPGADPGVRAGFLLSNDLAVLLLREQLTEAPGTDPTLLKILVGTMRADRGVVRLGGRLGYCPQEPVVIESLTVGQHLRYFAAAYRRPSLQRAEALADLLGFAEFRDVTAGALSGGTRQKLNLTLALLHDPDVLLLDEPYQGFDWETYLRFWDVVGDLRTRGKAVVIITHLVFEQDRFDVLADLAGGRLASRQPAEGESRVIG
jgi:ABC-2 type transport system ATP-binding protein